MGRRVEHHQNLVLFGGGSIELENHLVLEKADESFFIWQLETRFTKHLAFNTAFNALANGYIR